ncbi:MAG: response regulator [Patescibacteria group bacterium]|nr:response regulator [Patescibacteria group bacterium]MDD5164421.1 response regulator [Patescibacteria group bacterium]MDD5534602.1 response regulator [Patescibacteria group bacterium]
MTETIKKILIAEDEPDMRGILASMIESAGYNVVQAEDGERALNLAIKEKPDLILLDLSMPKMNGFEVLEKLKYDPVGSTIPVVILSNLGQDKEVVKGKSLGAVDYLIKSNVHLTDILDKISKYIVAK